MARTNVTGISFYQLDLERHEEIILKQYLRRKKFSMKQLMRVLVREHLKGEKLL